jgi:hypothetical protein
MEEKEETVKKHVSLTTAVCMLTLILSTGVQGVVIPLSTHTSEPTGPNSVPASWLSANMELSVNNDTGPWELTLAVTNNSGNGDFSFNISELYFNTSARITVLSLEEIVGANMGTWELNFNTDSILVGPFGYFDISIICTDKQAESIDPGETVTFKMYVETEELELEDDHFYDLSVENHLLDKWLGYGAAKFWGGGPEDLSAYGAYVPEPATILLLGLGMLTLLRKRR